MDFHEREELEAKFNGRYDAERAMYSALDPHYEAECDRLAGLPSPHHLACAFLEELRCAIRPEDLHLVFERNEAEPDKLICHSHDFCDANQCMLDAFARLGCPVEFESLNDELGELIEAAWAMALPRDGSRLSHAY
jgi:hypothetical protein